MWPWYARKKSMSHGKLSFIVKTMCETSVEGEWLKLLSTDYDFKVNISTSGAHFRGWLGFTSHSPCSCLMESLKLLEFALQNLHLELSSCINKITTSAPHACDLRLVLGCKRDWVCSHLHLTK